MLVNQLESSNHNLIQNAEAENDSRKVRKISEIIKDSRKRHGYSQEELAEKSGLSTMQISRIELSKNLPSVNTLVKLQPYTGCSLEELLIAASYSGVVPTAEKTYVDLKGRKSDLKSIAEEMYCFDAELLFKIYDFYKNEHSALDKKFMKSVLDILNAETKAEQSDETKKEKEDEKQYRIALNHLKSLFIWFGQKNINAAN